MPTSLWHVTSKSLRPTLWSACLARRQWWRCQGSWDATLMMQPILRPPQMHHRQYLMMQTQYLMFALTIDANSSSAPIFIDQRHMIYPVVAPTITWSGFQLYTKGLRNLARIITDGANILQQLPTITHWATLSKNLSFHCGGELWDLQIWNIALQLQYIMATLSNG